MVVGGRLRQLPVDLIAVQFGHGVTCVSLAVGVVHADQCGLDRLGAGGVGCGESSTDCRGHLLDQDQSRHGDDQPAERGTQGVLRYPAGQSGPEQGAGDGGGGDGEGQRPVQADGVEVAEQAGGGLDGDDEQRGADGVGDGQPGEQGHGCALGGQRDDRAPSTVDSGGGPAVAQHRGGGHGHGEPEADQQPGGGQVGGHAAAEVRAGYAGGGEDRCGTPADPAGSGVRNDGDGAGGRDDEQGHGDGWFGGYAGQVHQDRQGEDGAAAAEQPQRQPDEQRGGQDQRGHRRQTTRPGPPP